MRAALFYCDGLYGRFLQAILSLNNFEFSKTVFSRESIPETEEGSKPNGIEKKFYDILTERALSSFSILERS